ncbi:MAG: prephenate dehydrogenase [Phycisphaerae bacterium]
MIGVGLLGGSVALAAKRVFGAKVVGVGRRQASLDAALAVGAIDKAYLAAEKAGGSREWRVGSRGRTVHRASDTPYTPLPTPHFDLQAAVADSDLIILATPVGAFEDYLRAIAPALKKGAVVTDVGSTKALVVRSGEAILGRGGPFIGSHPMAGSEAKGVQFARADLLEGATCVITPTKYTPPRLTRFIEAFWRALGMKVVRMSPAAHDKSVAAVSHLPHALAGLLMLLPRDGDLKVAATGFRDMTRLASGDVEMWRDIILTNRRAILNAIDGFDESLVHLRDVIATGDGRGIENFLKAAKKRRGGLFG